MSDSIRVIQYGLGPIGSAVARYVVNRPDLELVGGVDIDPAKVGVDVGDAIGLDNLLGFSVREKLSEVLAESEAHVVLHTTNSYFDLFKDQVLEILEASLDVVSTSEELSFPWLANSAVASEISDAAERAGKTVLGTGINPGFLMDALPLFLTALSQRVERIDITRVINASQRRGPFQAKVGSGMSVDSFNSKMESGRMGHVGLPESMGMVFHTLKKELVHYEDIVEPIVADDYIKTGYFEVQPGQVRGLKQVARGSTAEGEFVTLTFIAALDESDDGDTIKITGVPNLEISLKGTNGDIGTAAITVNAVPRVLDAPPGLYTMRDLPIVNIGW